MITLKTESTFGNFAIEAEAQVSEAQRDVLAGLGLLQLLQRSPASAAEKALAGYDKRPAGFKRDSIPFSPENAEKVSQAFNKPIEVDGAEPFTPAVLVTEYIPTVGDVKMTDEREAYARNAEALPALAAKVDYTGPVGDGTTANAPVDFLRAIKTWKNDQLKKLRV